jgi:hypothetical protein
MSSGLSVEDIGVIVPFEGPSLYLKLQLRLHGLHHVEVGGPEDFRGRRKSIVVFDTTVAGIDHTLRQIDDLKSGEHHIARMLNTVFSAVGEDLYVIADLSHFQSQYKGRLITKLLMLLKAEADPLPPLADIVRRFDELSWRDREPSTVPGRKGEADAMHRRRSEGQARPKDAELEVRMRMTAKQREALLAEEPVDFEQQRYLAVLRVLGHLADVNYLSQYSQGELLFRRTPEAEAAIASLPKDLCTQEKEFSDVMERWNLLIYELSGGSKVTQSFFARQAPEAKARWDVNSLKAFYTADVEAALEEGKQKIAVAVSRIFQESLGKPQPEGPLDWTKAYLSFLGKLESYLQWISRELRK